MIEALRKLRAFISDRVFLTHGDNPILQFLIKFKFLFSVPPREYFKWGKIGVLAQVAPYTLLTYPRLSALYDLAQTVEKSGTPGDFVECGVCNGGSAGLVAKIFKPNAARHVWLFDSWEGMPAPNEKDKSFKGEAAEKGVALGYKEKVENLVFDRIHCSREKVHLEKGWFEKTLPPRMADIHQISLLHLDCDWYESIKLCLNQLYDKVAPGGYIVIDDYGYWKGCHQAVDEFFKSRNLTQKLIPIDYSGVYFQK